MNQDPFTPPAWHIVVKQIGGWRALLVILPAAVLIIALAGVLFTLFASLFAVAAAVLGIRFWWLQRKLKRHPAGPQTLEGDYVVIEHRRERLHDPHDAP